MRRQCFPAYGNSPRRRRPPTLNTPSSLQISQACLCWTPLAVNKTAILDRWRKSFEQTNHKKVHNISEEECETITNQNGGLTRRQNYDGNSSIPLYRSWLLWFNHCENTKKSCQTVGMYFHMPYDDTSYASRSFSFVGVRWFHQRLGALHLQKRMSKHDTFRLWNEF